MPSRTPDRDTVLNYGGGVSSVVVGELYVPPPPPGGGWGDGKAFGARPIQSTPLQYSGVSNLVIEDLFFDNSAKNPSSPFIYSGSNSHCAVLLDNCTNVTVRNCDFSNVSQPIAIVNGGSGHVIEYCRADGIMGPASRLGVQSGNFCQTVGAPTNITVSRNKIKAEATWDPWGGAYMIQTEDVISFYSASNSYCEDNWIDSTNYVSDYGTGIIAGDAFGANVLIQNNRLLNPGQVGIAVAGDPDHLVNNNWIWRDIGQNPGSGDTAAYCWDYNGNTPTNNVVFSNNRAFFQNGKGAGNFYNPGPPPATEINNDWNDTTLTRADVEFTL